MMVTQFTKHLRQILMDPDIQVNLLSTELTVATM